MTTDDAKEILSCMERMDVHPDEIYIVSRVLSSPVPRCSTWGFDLMGIIDQTGETVFRAWEVIDHIEHVLHRITNDAKLVNGTSKLFQRMLPVLVSEYLDSIESKSIWKIESTRGIISRLISRINPLDLPQLLQDNPEVPMRACISGLIVNRHFADGSLIVSDRLFRLFEVLISHIIAAVRQDLAKPARGEWDFELMKMWRWVDDQTFVPRTRVLELCTRFLKTPSSMLAVATDMIERNSPTLEKRRAFASQLASPAFYGVSALDLPGFQWPKVGFHKTRNGMKLVPCPRFKRHVNGHFQSIGLLLVDGLGVKPVVEVVLSYLRARV